MKKIFVIFSLLVFALAVFSQERTVELAPIKKGETYKKYSGVAADTLVATNQDTIDVVFEYNGPGYVKKVALKSRFDLIDGADTTVSVSLFGKEFADDATYVQIIGATATDDINADNAVQILTSDWTESVASYNITLPALTLLTDTTGLMGYPADSIVSNAATIVAAAQTITPPDKSYRYYRARYILTAASGAGAGVKLDEIELKLYTEN